MTKGLINQKKITIIACVFLLCITLVGGLLGFKNLIFAEESESTECNHSYQYRNFVGFDEDKQEWIYSSGENHTVEAYCELCGKEVYADFVLPYSFTNKYDQRVYDNGTLTKGVCIARVSTAEWGNISPIRIDSIKEFGSGISKQLQIEIVFGSSDHPCRTIIKYDRYYKLCTSGMLSGENIYHQYEIDEDLCCDGNIVATCALCGRTISAKISYEGNDIPGSDSYCADESLSSKIYVDDSNWDYNWIDCNIEFDVYVPQYNTSLYSINKKILANSDGLCSLYLNCETPNGLVSVHSADITLLGVDCDKHNYENYIVEGQVVKAECTVCGEEHSVKLIVGGFSDPEHRVYYRDITDLSKYVYIDYSNWDEKSPEVSLIIGHTYDSGYVEYTSTFKYVNAWYSAAMRIKDGPTTEAISYYYGCGQHDENYPYDYIPVKSYDSYPISEYLWLRCTYCWGYKYRLELQANSSLDTSGSGLAIWNASNADEYPYSILVYDEENKQYMDKYTNSAEFPYNRMAVVYEYSDLDGETKISLQPPTFSCTCTAYIAMLSDIEDVSTVYYKGCGKQFNINGSTVNNNNVTIFNFGTKAIKNGKTYTVLRTGGKLSSGSYILTSNLYLTNPIVIDGEGTNVTIDLNGYSIVGDKMSDYKSPITVQYRASLTLENDEGATGGVSYSRTYQSTIEIYFGTLTLKNVKVSGASAYGIHGQMATVNINGKSAIIKNNSGGVCIEEGVVNMYSGSIHDNGGAGIHIENKTFDAYYHYDSGVNMSGGSIYNQAKGIEAAEQAFVKLSGSAKINKNTIGVYLQKDSHFTATDNATVSGNNTAGVMLYDNQTATVGRKAVVEFGIIDPVSNYTDMEFLVSDVYSGIENHICSQTISETIYMKRSNVIGDDVVVRSVSCQPHAYVFNVGDYDISANCVNCYTEGYASYKMAAFDSEYDYGYLEGQNISDLIYIDVNNWDIEHAPAYPTLVYGYVSTEDGSIEYSTKVPSEVGVYSVRLAILEDPDDPCSEYSSTEEVFFAIISHEACEEHNIFYTGEHKYLTIRCADCGRAVSKARITVNNHDINDCFVDDGYTMLYLCCDDQIAIEYDDNWFDYGEELCLVYCITDENGNIDYTLDAPTEVGRYSVTLALLPDINNPYEVVVETDPVIYEIKYHRWEYSADKDTIYAKCAVCDESASVHVLVAGAFDASRNYDEKASEEYYEYEVIFQENWVGQKGIEQFYALYDGIAVINEFNSTYKDSVFIKPTISGNYAVRLALLKDISDPDTAFVSTEYTPYYLAGTPINDPYIKITDYTEDQYKHLVAPEKINGSYQVDSFEDLMWLSRYGESDASINITKDIIVNPISISRDGKTVRVGSNVVYRWKGICANIGSDHYHGTINGNGHTIYGLYSDSTTSEYSGFVNDAWGTTVKDLTISDSFFTAKSYAGGIAGRFNNASKSWCAGHTSITNCNVLYCSIKTSAESSYAGGIAGMIEVSGGTNVIVNNCVVSGRVESGASGYAGGIIGYYKNTIGGSQVCPLTITSCKNVASVYGNNAGGMIGYYNSNSSSGKLLMNYCSNGGSIEASEYAGGIIGNIGNIPNTSEINLCRSVGTVSVDTSNANAAFGGLVGHDKNGNFARFYFNEYYAKTAIGKLDSGLLSSCSYANAYSLNKSQSKNTYLCSAYVDDKSQIKQHIEGSEWIIEKATDCEHDGLVVKKCLICGEVIESKVIPAYGHSYAFGDCINCGAKEGENQTASVFSKPTYMIAMAAVIVASSTVAIIVSKKKKNKKA